MVIHNFPFSCLLVVLINTFDGLDSDLWGSGQLRQLLKVHPSGHRIPRSCWIAPLSSSLQQSPAVSCIRDRSPAVSNPFQQSPALSNSLQQSPTLSSSLQTVVLTPNTPKPQSRAKIQGVLGLWFGLPTPQNHSPGLRSRGVWDCGLGLGFRV